MTRVATRSPLSALLALVALALPACGGISDPLDEERGDGVRQKSECTVGCWDEELYFRYAYPRKEQLDIQAKALGFCMAKAIKDRRTRRAPIVWNKHKAACPDLVSYLAAGARCESGFETELREWIMRQPDNSVAPHQFFAAALDLADGDVFAATMAGHELLRNEARFMAEWIESSGFVSDYEKLTAFFAKLVDIRGDLRERGPGFVGDHPGTWYRFFGMLLYTIGASPIDHAGVGPSNLGFSWALVSGMWGAQTAEDLKLATITINGVVEHDHRKRVINERGAATMYYLLQAAFGSRSMDLKLSCAPSDYLLPLETCKKGVTPPSLIGWSTPAHCSQP
ncbi:MAG: hypothetical protein IT371_24480 [Deltaproteobacteria bacterium]|nr:hypothetical protein [Deltaproteobacteria bacterium]